MNNTWSEIRWLFSNNEVGHLMLMTWEDRGELPEMGEQVPDWVQYKYNDRVNRKRGNKHGRRSS